MDRNELIFQCSSCDENMSAWIEDDSKHALKTRHPHAKSGTAASGQRFPCSASYTNIYADIKKGVPVMAFAAKASVAHPVAHNDIAHDIASKLIGAWRLVSWSETKKDGGTNY